ncbi:MAG TPA: hypothetical protein VK871_05535, partial [Candidatus Limnocylindrales bacterium]|nr:hypothetical protein [Candidatus Limnocylindrales bacterium]
LAGEAIEEGAAEYNPFLEEGGVRPTDEAAGLALAATIAGSGDEEAEFNPFLAEAEADESEESEVADEAAADAAAAEAEEEGAEA